MFRTDIIVDELWDKEHDLYLLSDLYLYCKEDIEPEHISSLRASILFPCLLAKEKHKCVYTQHFKLKWGFYYFVDNSHWYY